MGSSGCRTDTQENHNYTCNLPLRWCQSPTPAQVSVQPGLLDSSACVSHRPRNALCLKLAHHLHPPPISTGYTSQPLPQAQNSRAPLASSLQCPSLLMSLTASCKFPSYFSFPCALLSMPRATASSASYGSQ